jgi:hypothetical protein
LPSALPSLFKDERTKLPEGESLKRVGIADAKSAIRWFRKHAEVNK